MDCFVFSDETLHGFCFGQMADIAAAVNQFVRIDERHIAQRTLAYAALCPCVARVSEYFARPGSFDTHTHGGNPSA